MKNPRLIAKVMLLVLMAVMPALLTHAQQSAASLQDTTDFIVRTLTPETAEFEIEAHWGQTGYSKIGQHVNYNVSFSGCKITYRKITVTGSNLINNAWYSGIELSNISLPLGKVRPAQFDDMPKAYGWQDNPNDPDLRWSATKLYYLFTVPFRVPEPYIKQRTERGVDGDRESTTTTSSVWILHDEQTANRARNALTHAVTLCGGKTDPF